MTGNTAHLRKLEHLFLSAAIQQSYPGITIALSSGKSTITYPVQDAQFHGGNALHGSIYFKLLDDAAYFAAAGLHAEHFIVTARFSIRFLKPVTGGQLIATGTCSEATGNIIKAGSTLVDMEGQPVASGEGIFKPVDQRWDALPGYM